MWFGAVFADCAVFLGPDGAVFAFFRWQESCFDNPENMKTANALPGNSWQCNISRGWLGLAQA
jgi:hypothetical protein